MRKIIVSVTKEGNVKFYPLKYIKTKKIKVFNKKINFTSSKELLNRVEYNRHLESYSKRLKKTAYKCAIIYWKEFEYEFDKWLLKLSSISTEEGNTLKEISNRNLNINTQINATKR